MSHSKQYLVLVIAKRFCFNYSSICACVHWNLNLYIEESERRQNNTKTNHLKCIFNANSVFEICSEENVKWRKQDFLWNEKKNQIKSRVEHMFVFFSRLNCRSCGILYWVKREWSHLKYFTIHLAFLLHLGWDLEWSNCDTVNIIQIQYSICTLYKYFPFRPFEMLLIFLLSFDARAVQFVCLAFDLMNLR